ncbi:DUF3105 domain-containing protein [Glycomyces sp. A-F 0318]|uniref:DUF3105 domain-containing protein n=1 Tax=Glycomyces amatae TaxID=2881355 RepID=UPI001E3FA384|nr:DUF3105 domain-containing protein [Glycomyces amatae]MCD0442662.1 DUF3105 domain-containing protein [Glycomyces amatae]
MASKKQTASKSAGKGSGTGAVKSDGKPEDKKAQDTKAAKAEGKKSEGVKTEAKKAPAKSSKASARKPAGKSSATTAPARGKGRAVQVKQPKPWGLIWTFTGVGVVALGLIGAAIFVVWDRSQPPEGITSYYGDYANVTEAKAAIADGDITEEDLENPWVVQQTHVDGEDPAAVPEYEVTPPAGGNHLSQWQTCTGSVYDAPIVDGNAVHSLEHGAVWLTYDPALVDGDGIDQLASKIEGRDYSLMSPYQDLGVEVSVQAWGVQYQTSDLNDPKIDEFLDFYIQNSDNLAEMNATCSGGISTTIADQQMPTG